MAAEHRVVLSELVAVSRSLEDAFLPDASAIAASVEARLGAGLA